MSVRSWLREFMPDSAENVTPDEALEHSLRKWRGLTPKNLRDHGLVLCGSRLYARGDSSNIIYISGNTCALCTHFFNPSSGKRKKCEDCPLTKQRGRACDSGRAAPYSLCVEDGDVQPMLDVIEKAYANFRYDYAREEYTKMAKVSDMHEPYRCDCCGRIEERSNLPDAENLRMRLTPGDIYTDKECLAKYCGALCYPVPRKAELKKTTKKKTHAKKQKRK